MLRIASSNRASMLAWTSLIRVFRAPIRQIMAIASTTVVPAALPTTVITMAVRSFIGIDHNSVTYTEPRQRSPPPDAFPGGLEAAALGSSRRGIGYAPDAPAAWTARQR